MTDHDSRAAQERNSQRIDSRGRMQSRDAPRRKPCRGQPTLADIDNEDPQGKPFALRTQCIGAPGIPAAQGADIHAPTHPADDQSTDERTEQIGNQGFYAQFEHGAIHVQGPANSTMLTWVRIGRL